MNVDNPFNSLIYGSDLNAKRVKPIFDHLALVYGNIAAGDIIQWDRDVKMVIKA